MKAIGTWGLSVAMVAGAISCGRSQDMQPCCGAPVISVHLMSVSPSGNSDGVPRETALKVSFSATIGSNWERYVDLHEGDTSGPTVAMACSWSADRTLLSCQPGTALEAQTHYTVHIGDGMMSASGQPVIIDLGLQMGGQWLTATMMGGQHAGSPTSLMGAGWHGSNGSYGMIFPFSTQ